MDCFITYYFYVVLFFFWFCSLYSYTCIQLYVVKQNFKISSSDTSDVHKNTLFKIKNQKFSVEGAQPPVDTPHPIFLGASMRHPKQKSCLRH